MQLLWNDVGDTCGAKPAELYNFCMVVITETLEMESNLKKKKIYLRHFFDPLSLRVPFYFHCVYALSIPGGKGSTVISLCTTENWETEDVRPGFSEVTANLESCT